MSAPRTSLRCEGCGGWVSLLASNCKHCGARQLWPGAIDLTRGRSIHSLSLDHEALPGLRDDGSDSERGARGVTFPIAPLTARLGTLPTKLLNSCVAARVTARGPETTVGVVSRSVTEGVEASGYAAELWPAQQQWRLIRWVRSENGIEFDAVQDWKRSRAIATEGEWNQIELRAGSTRLEVHVQGERVFAEDDRYFGYGRCGWIARANRATGEATFANVEVFMLA